MSVPNRRVSLRVAPTSPTVTAPAPNYSAPSPPTSSTAAHKLTAPPSLSHPQPPKQPPQHPSADPQHPSSTHVPLVSVYEHSTFASQQTKPDGPPPSLTVNTGSSQGGPSTPQSQSMLGTPSSTSSLPHRSSLSGYKTMRSLRSTMDPSIYSPTVGEVQPETPQSQLPAHLARNNLQPELSTTRTKPEAEVSIVRTKEDEEEDAKLREKEKGLSWDDIKRLEEHAYLVRQEVLSTEGTYVKNLAALCLHYVGPLERIPADKLVEEIGITAAHRTALVSNLNVINGFQQKFHEDLVRSGPMHCEQTLIEYSPYFRLYSQYATDYQKMVDTLAALATSKKFQAFTTIVDHHLAGPGGNGSELLSSYLILPIQRIPRYELLLRELKRHSLPSSPSFDKINKALALVRQTATHINETNKRVENMHKLIALQKRIKGDMKDFVLVQPHRHQLREAQVSLSEPHKHSLFGTIKKGPRIIFLFNDILLWTNYEYEFKLFFNVASISSLDIIEPYVVEIATSEKFVHLNFHTEKGPPPDPSSDKGRELKQARDDWFGDLSRLVDEGQAERRRKRTIQSRNDTQRNATHRLIVNKFNTLDRKQMEELKRAQEEGGEVQ